MSYRCLPNMGTKLSQHNNRILKEATPLPEKPRKTCNCQDPGSCPLPDQCNLDNMVYRAKITTNSEVNTYVGLTKPTFKIRHGNHEQDFKNPARMHSTTLSTYIWSLKEADVVPKIEYEMVSRATPFTPVTNRCNLCTEEKYWIIYNPEKASLNKRQELYSHCRHKVSELLIKKKTKRKRK